MASAPTRFPLPSRRMKYRALFVGGAVDGQERVLPHCNGFISIRGQPQCVYHRLFAFGEPATLVYSLYDIAETLNRLWHRYAGEDHA
jgi:hypothetical protein